MLSSTRSNYFETWIWFVCTRYSKQNIDQRFFDIKLSQYRVTISKYQSIWIFTIYSYTMIRQHSFSNNKKVKFREILSKYSH